MYAYLKSLFMGVWRETNKFDLVDLKFCITLYHNKPQKEIETPEKFWKISGS